MSSIGTRLKESREKKGLLQSELAKLIGVKSAGVISNWEQDINKPNADKMVEICQVLDISLSYLLNYYGKEKAPSLSDEAMKLATDYDDLDEHGKRVVRLVADEEKDRCKEEWQKQADIFRKQRGQIEVAEEIAPEDIYSIPLYSLPMSAGTGQEAGQEYPEDFLLKKRPPRGTSFIARVSGNSMEPTYHDGDLVFIHATVDICPGQTGAFLMDGQLWIKELGDGVLISHNPDYEPRQFTEDIRCQGLVLGVCDESYFEESSRQGR
jgi:repressor LexA